MYNVCLAYFFLFVHFLSHISTIFNYLLLISLYIFLGTIPCVVFVSLSLFFFFILVVHFHLSDILRIFALNQFCNFVYCFMSLNLQRERQKLEMRNHLAPLGIVARSFNSIRFHLVGFIILYRLKLIC